MSNGTSFCASGDCFLNRVLPDSPGSAFEALAALIGRADVRLTNLETTVDSGGCYPAATSGGTWARADAEVLSVFKKYHFNLVGWANNHSLDYSHGGLLATARALDEAGLKHAGAGEDLAAASAPAFL
ncbi:MAG TPA: CapA family protein, partial [Sediminispirochaeta sp.]|nr:CapA family protein [Sediminispirochaeta sp.]